MEWIILIALLFLSWFLATNGMEFFSSLVLIITVLYAAVGMISRPAQSKSSGIAPASNQPIIVQTGSQESIPSLIKVKVKPNWSSNEPWETAANDIGKIINNIGRTLTWIFRGFKGPKDD